jgi:hypothetical protein
MFYEIYVDGEPTGMGSTNRIMAEAMVKDYEYIYNVKAEIKETPDEK